MISNNIQFNAKKTTRLDTAAVRHTVGALRTQSNETSAAWLAAAAAGAPAPPGRRQMRVLCAI